MPDPCWGSGFLILKYRFYQDTLLCTTWKGGDGVGDPMQGVLVVNVPKESDLGLPAVIYRVFRMAKGYLDNT